MKEYFENIKTLEALRKAYKQLLKKYHPDNWNGSETVTKEINIEYERVFNQLKNEHESKQTCSESTYTSNMYNWENDKILRRILQKVINFEGVEIEICGQWIWVFHSFVYRKELKELGFGYAANKKAWYFHTKTFRKAGKKTLSMEDIRNYYGSTEIVADSQKKLIS